MKLSIIVATSMVLTACSAPPEQTKTQQQHISNTPYQFQKAITLYQGTNTVDTGVDWETQLCRIQGFAGYFPASGANSSVHLTRNNAGNWEVDATLGVPTSRGYVMLIGCAPVNSFAATQIGWFFDTEFVATGENRPSGCDGLHGPNMWAALIGWGGPTLDIHHDISETLAGGPYEYTSQASGYSVGRITWADCSTWQTPANLSGAYAASESNQSVTMPQYCLAGVRAIEGGWQADGSYFWINAVGYPEYTNQLLVSSGDGVNYPYVVADCLPYR
jgi:hypothetical protein